MATEEATSFEPEAIAHHQFPSSFRGYDTQSVRAFLISLAAEQRDLRARLAVAEATAADVVAAAEQRGVAVLREAQDEARRQLAAVSAEREQAYASGVADGEAAREALLADARAEAEATVAEAKAAREKVLADLRRRRKAARTQVEQLLAARERLLAALTTVRGAIDATTSGLRDALPDAKSAADAAARRVEAEAEASVEQLDAEIEALRLAGLSFGAVSDTGADAEAEGDPEDAAEAEPAVVSPPAADSGDRRSSSVRIIRPMRPSDPVTGLPEGELEPVDAPDPVEEVRLLAVDDVPPEPEPEPAVEPESEPEPEPEAEALTEPAAAAEAEPEAEPEPAAVAEAEPEAEPDPEPEPAAVAESEADPELDDEPESERLSPDAVDALFARLRAGREVRVAGAEAVLEPEPETVEPRPEPEAVEPEPEPEAVEPEPEPEPEAVEPEPEPEPEAVEPEPEPEAEPDAVEAPARDDGLVVHRGGGAAREALLARRDELVAPAQAALARRLKRVLADEQNELLDAIRRLGPAAALPDVDDHAGRWAQAAGPDLTLAAAAGSSFLGGDAPVVEPTPGELAEVAEQLAAVVARPLHERLVRVVEAADVDGDAAAAGVRACYRTWRTERLLPAADHAVLDAFALGVDRALGEGTPVCWIADDGGVPCPDAEDNALAGEVPCGLRFPTGHLRPPAHHGCRCLVARVGT